MFLISFLLVSVSTLAAVHKRYYAKILIHNHTHSTLQGFHAAPKNTWFKNFPTYVKEGTNGKFRVVGNMNGSATFYYGKKGKGYACEFSFFAKWVESKGAWSFKGIPKKLSTASAKIKSCDVETLSDGTIVFTVEGQW